MHSPSVSKARHGHKQRRSSLAAFFGPEGASNRNFAQSAVRGTAIVLLSVTALTVPTSMSPITSGVRGGPSGTVVTFAVAPLAEISELRHPAELQIEPRHLVQGYVDLDAATTLRLSTNSDAVALQLEFSPDVITAARLRVGDAEQTISTSGGEAVIASRRAANVPLSISYRLYLGRSARAGSQPWPLKLRVLPRRA